MKGQRIIPSLTPEDPVKLFDILKKHFDEIERKSVFSRANKDSQTAMDHKEAEEQQKAMKEMEKEEKADERAKEKEEEIEMQANQTCDQLEVKPKA